MLRHIWTNILVILHVPRPERLRWYLSRDDQTKKFCPGLEENTVNCGWVCRPQKDSHGVRSVSHILQPVQRPQNIWRNATPTSLQDLFKETVRNLKLLLSVELNNSSMRWQHKKQDFQRILVNKDRWKKKSDQSYFSRLSVADSSKFVRTERSSIFLYVFVFFWSKNMFVDGNVNGKNRW